MGIQNSATIYSGSTGGGTIPTGYFMRADECWVYSAAAYYSEDCCVLEGTLISTSPSSSIAVEDLEVGDTVLSKNIKGMPDSDDFDDLREWTSSTLSGAQSTAIVTANPSISINSIYNINEGTLYTSATHMHIVKREGIWSVKRTHTLEEGDYYEDINGNLIEITSIALETRAVTIYKLNVETDDVYYANGILTHNIK